MDIETLDLNLLLVFEALLRTRSVTQAAEHLGIGQPSMSGALKRLRTALNDPLFVKTGTGMVPTTLALELAEPVRAGLAQLRDALVTRQHFEPADTARRFDLYMSDTAQLVFLPDLLHLLRGSAPQVRLKTHPAEMRQARRMLAEGELDLALGFFIDLDDGLHRSILFVDRYVCIAHAGHPTIRGSCTLAQLAEAGHLVYRPAVGSHHVVDEHISAACAAIGRPRRAVLEVTHGTGIAETVAASDLVACVPAALAALHQRTADVQVLELPTELALPPIEISMYWHERAHRDPALAWLREQVRALFGAR